MFKISTFFFFVLLITPSRATQIAMPVIISKADSIPSFCSEILYYVNQHRRNLSLKDLSLIDAANNGATKHSQDMANGIMEFGHAGFEERVDDIFKKIGECKGAAENVAMASTITAKDMVDMWLKSPGHKKNIEGNYTLTGIGIAYSKNGSIYCTQIFLLK